MTRFELSLELAMLLLHILLSGCWRRCGCFQLTRSVA